MKSLPLPVVKTVFSRSLFRSGFVLRIGTEDIALIRMTGGRAVVPGVAEARLYTTVTAVEQGEDAVKRAEKVARRLPHGDAVRTAIFRKMVLPYRR